MGINGWPYGSEMSFVNHFTGVAKFPNVVFYGTGDTVTVQTLADIPMGTELLVDYGPMYVADWLDTAVPEYMEYLLTTMEWKVESVWNFARRAEVYKGETPHDPERALANLVAALRAKRDTCFEPG